MAFDSSLFSDLFNGLTLNSLRAIDHSTLSTTRRMSNLNFKCFLNPKYMHNLTNATKPKRTGRSRIYWFSAQFLLCFRLEFANHGNDVTCYEFLSSKPTFWIIQIYKKKQTKTKAVTGSERTVSSGFKELAPSLAWSKQWCAIPQQLKLLDRMYLKFTSVRYSNLQPIRTFTADYISCGSQKQKFGFANFCELRLEKIKLAIFTRRLKIGWEKNLYWSGKRILTGLSFLWHDWSSPWIETNTEPNACYIATVLRECTLRIKLLFSARQTQSNYVPFLRKRWRLSSLLHAKRFSVDKNRYES